MFDSVLIVTRPSSFSKIGILHALEIAIYFMGNEIRLTPLPMFPVSTIAKAAGMLAKRGSKKSDEKETRAKIAKTLNARDAATRK